MTNRTRTTSSDPLLASVREAADDDRRVQVVKLTAVLDWASAHVATAVETAELLDPGVEPALHLAGPGAPVIGEYSALDLALSLGGSTDSGLTYLRRALELRHRLPRLLARVVALEVPIWQAFRVCDQTISLPQDGAAYVDRAVAPFLHRCSWAQIERTVEAARVEFDPVEAERRRLAAAESRHAEVHLDAASSAGTVEVSATLDLTDGIDLEAALRDGAQTLADLGSTESLDVRRSQALGEMARQQLALDLDTSQTTSSGRGITLYVHLDGNRGDGFDTTTGTVDNTQTPVLIDQVRQWCQSAGTKVTVKPVIDLAADPETTAYRPTEAIRELVTLRDRTCVFPHCHRRRVDLDHIHPFDAGGTTSAHNLAMLCRRHHRAKTHGRWRYRMLVPGVHEWTSPTGLTSWVDRRPPPSPSSTEHRRRP